MKKMILLVAVLALTLGLMAGCRRGNEAQSAATEISGIASEVMPDPHAGDATDHDGIISGDNAIGTRSGFRPICD